MASELKQQYEKLIAAKKASEKLFIGIPAQWGKNEFEKIIANGSRISMQSYHIVEVGKRRTIVRESYFPLTAKFSVQNIRLSTQHDWDKAIEEWSREIMWGNLKQGEV